MIRVSELTGALLDFWTGRAEGYKPWFTRLAPGARQICTIGVAHDDGAVTAKFYRPSTDWAQGGPLIDKHRFSYIGEVARLEWSANTEQARGEGSTPLQAICRAVVSASFGDEVEEINITE